MTAFYEDLLRSADRDLCPGAGRCVSVHGDEPEEELASLEEHASAIVALRRRGIDHGSLAEFDPQDPEGTEAAATAGAPSLDLQLEARWQSAKPIVIHDLLPALDPTIESERQAWFEQLAAREGLRDWLDGRQDALSPEFLVGAESGRLSDPQRDIAKRMIEAAPRRGEPASRSGPPWAKVAALSTHRADASLRLRLGFGEEGPDDANADPTRLRQVRRLAEALLPDTAAIHAHPQLAALLTPWLGAEPLYSQHLAYWNAPSGGALFHHDAFGPSAEGGQRGVLYVQRSGWTAWLALSIDDLAHRVMEFVEYLAEDDFAALRAGLLPKPGAFEQVQRWCAPGRFARLRRELGLPGQGALAALVNCGPEFTGLLADAGHAYVLGPGDGILLPNHGVTKTCMHSVFCAGPEVAYSLSMGLFSSEVTPPLAGRNGQQGSRRGPSRAHGTRRRRSRRRRP